jgi:type I restriction enzyme S subunit
VKSVKSVVKKEIVRRVESLFLLADQIDARLRNAASRLGGITPSLPPSPRLRRTGLARAFSGKLVPQDPNAEPASALVERIRQEGPRITLMPRMKEGKENP